MSPDVESEPSQSFSSLGVNDSMENLEFDGTTHAFTPITTEIAVGSKVAPSDAIQKAEPDEDGKMEEVATPIGETHVDHSEDSKDTVPEVIADTTIDDSDSLESSAAMRNKSIHDKMDISNMVEQVPAPSVEILRGAGAPVQAGSTEGGPAMRSMRDKLQGLISELATAALTREEVSVFEDMFMDAKEKLYGAARRGRADSG